VPRRQRRADRPHQRASPRSLGRLVHSSRGALRPRARRDQRLARVASWRIPTPLSIV
jgi:hypothetical protein